MNLFTIRLADGVVEELRRFAAEATGGDLEAAAEQCLLLGLARSRTAQADREAAERRAARSVRPEAQGEALWRE